MKRKDTGVMNANSVNRDYADSLVNQPASTPPAACIICGGDVEAAPMREGVCYSCYLASVRPAPAQPDPFAEPAAPEAEQQAKELSHDTGWLTAEAYGQVNYMSRDEQIPLEHMGRKFSGSDYEPAWMSEAAAQHADWLDEQNTKESDYPR